MKKQIITSLLVLISSNLTYAEDPFKSCNLNSVLGSESEIENQVSCIQDICIDQLVEIAKSEVSDNEQVAVNEEREAEDSRNIRDIIIDENQKEIQACIKKVYEKSYKENKKQREAKIAILKKKISSKEDLEELISLITIDETEDEDIKLKIVEIKDIIFDNIKFWTEEILTHLLKAALYNEEAFLDYLKNLNYDKIHLSQAFNALLKNGSGNKIQAYILEKNEITPAILQLPVNHSIAALIVSSLEDTNFNTKYLKHVKHEILKNQNIISLLNEKLGNNIQNKTIKNAFLSVFQSDYKNELWVNFIIFTGGPLPEHFDEIDLKKRKDDLKRLTNYFNENSFKQVPVLLSILLKIDEEIFNQQISDIIKLAKTNKEKNQELLSFIYKSKENITASNLNDFIYNSNFDLNIEINIYYLTYLTQNSLSDTDYFEFIRKKFLESNNSSLLIYASYFVDQARLIEIIELTDQSGIDLISNINPDLIKNVNSWIAYTERCIKNQCSKLSSLLEISNFEIYNTIFSHGTIPQMMTAVSRIVNPASNISFSYSHIENFIKTIETREYNLRFTVVKNQLERILKQSRETITSLLSQTINETISLSNIEKRITDLNKLLPLIRTEDLDKAKLTNTLLELENYLANANSKEQGIVLKSLYSLVRLEKTAISNNLILDIDQKSILYGLKNLYDQTYDSTWATDYIINKLSLEDNFVMDITDENKALYEAFVVKYALGSADENKLKSLSYSEVDKLGKIIKAHTELPRQLHYDLQEVDYEDILKEFFTSFNAYFSTYKNVQINIPLTCEVGDNCVYDMKYNRNIGALTTISSSASAISYAGTNLKVYKNRDITIIGSLNDVLFIDGSVAKEIIPDQRPRAASGILPVISTKKRNVTYCVFRVKTFFGNVCMKKNTATLTDEYVVTRGYAPKDGLKGFTGANSSEIILNLHKSSMSKFARIIILNNSGQAGKGQPGGIWENAPTLGSGRNASGSSESDFTAFGNGFGFGSPGKGKKVSLAEAIPDYKDRGADGANGEHGSMGKIELNNDASQFKFISIGQKPE